MSSFHHCAFVIDKPVGESSTHYVQATRKKIASEWGIPFRDITIGHGGTLDPFASGVLVVLCGFATRLSEIYLKGDKEYLATVCLGTKTATADRTGTILLTEQEHAKNHSLLEWQAFADHFAANPYLQMPPQYSAKKVDGIPAYQHARAGQEVALAPKLQKIRSIKILSATQHEMQFSVTCASGTYIRTLAEDLAERGGRLAHLTELRRTRKAEFTLNHATTFDAFQLDQHAIPFHALGSDLQETEISAAQVAGIFQGDQRTIQESVARLNRIPPDQDSEYALLRHRNQTIALAHSAQGVWQFQRAFPLAYDATEAS